MGHPQNGCRYSESVWKMSALPKNWYGTIYLVYLMHLHSRCFAHINSCHPPSNPHFKSEEMEAPLDEAAGPESHRNKWRSWESSLDNRIQSSQCFQPPHQAVFTFYGTRKVAGKMDAKITILLKKGEVWGGWQHNVLRVTHWNVSQMSLPGRGQGALGQGRKVEFSLLSISQKMITFTEL